MPGHEALVNELRFDGKTSGPEAAQLNPRDLSLVTDLGDIIVAQGKYALSIGSGQPGTGVPSVNGNLEIKGQIVLPE